MTSTAERIFEALSGKGYVSANDLAKTLGFKDGRQLRASGDYEGLLVEAEREIWSTHGMTIITRMEDPPGIKLTKDVQEVKDARAQWHAWGAKIMERAKRMDVRIQMMTGGLGL